MSKLKLDNNYKVPPSLREIDEVYEIEEKLFSDSEKLYKNNLRGFSRKVDILLTCVFYGIYKSQKLPPIENWKKVSFGNDFVNLRYNANIQDSVDIIRNLLFLLWMKKKNKKFKSTDKFRKDLYDFLDILLNPDYFVNCIVPFYLCFADENTENDISFIQKLANSAFIDYRESLYSPETIALELNQDKEEFFENMQFITQEFDYYEFLGLNSS